MRRLVPGAPDLSAILVRMRTRERVARMLPLATEVVDTEAMQRVEQWIWELGPHPTR